jgi:hypothetical protein
MKNLKIMIIKDQFRFFKSIKTRVKVEAPGLKIVKHRISNLKNIWLKINRL